MTHLLVVDDEPSLLEALYTILSDAGYDVQTATSGQAALETLEASKTCLPDLLIADIVMFEMTGLQLFETVRACPELSGIPFLFTSAFISPEREQLIAGLNNAALLLKPYEVEDLLSAIAAICGPTPNQ